MEKCSKQIRGRLRDYRKKIQELENRFLNIVEKNPDGQVIIDTEKKVRYINRAGEKLLNLKKEEITGNLFPFSFLPDEKIELEIKKDDKTSIIEMCVTISEWKDAPVYLASFRDITEHKNNYKKLKNAEALSYNKDQFLAHVSHEIRTPMSGIIGITELALETEMSKEQKEYMEIIKQSGDLILSIINRLLKHSKIEAKKLELEEIDFNLSDTIETTIKTFAWQARKKGLELTYEIQENIPPLLKGDPECLQQVIINLLGNAFKFTGQGKISLRVEKKTEKQKDGKEDTVTLQFTISDTGIGISGERREEIFESYTQADKSIRRNYGGTGLGLSISKQIVKLMGGEIWLESTEGKGSSFHFTASFKTGEKSEKIAKKIPAQPDNERYLLLDILLVEDDMVNQKLAKTILEKAGHRVVTAGNGKEAIKKLEEQNFHIVMMDIKMPLLDGIEATKIIRNSNKGIINPKIPIIALTAHNMKGDREKFLKAGMDDYITKPLSKKSLLKIIRKFSGEIKNEDKIEREMKNQFRHILDKEGTLERFGDDIELAKEMWKIFIEEGEKKLKILEKRMEEKNFPSLEMEAHSLKAAAINIGAEILSDAAYEMEMATAGKDLKNTIKTYEKVRE